MRTPAKPEALLRKFLLGVSVTYKLLGNCFLFNQLNKNLINSESIQPTESNQL